MNKASGVAGNSQKFAASLCCLALFFLLSACTGRVDSLANDVCQTAGGLTPICGFQMPEDLVLLPDHSGILVSEYGSMGSLSGRLSLLDLSDHSRRLLYDESGGSSRPAIWGDPSCQQAQHFSPHGIDLSLRPSGRWQLLVVNHADQRESVEWFELQRRDEHWQLIWRGCVEASDDSIFNDVAAAGDGFFVTRMMPRDRGAWSFVDYFLKLRQGFVWHWTPQRGLVRVVGSEGVMPNGIAVDSENLYVNFYGEKKMKIFQRDGGAEIAALSVGNVDNSNWDITQPEKLLLASHYFSFLDMLICMRDSAQNCAAPFKIVEIDSTTLARQTLLQSDGQFFGSATAAVRVGDDIYIGSFAGRRILRAPVGYGVDNYLSGGGRAIGEP